VFIQTAAPEERELDELTALRAQVSFKDPAELERHLELLSPYFKAPHLVEGLLRVEYTPTTLSPQAGRLHRDFMATHLSCSSYLPLCVPEVHAQDVSAWATPSRCLECLFHESGRCDGLGGESADRARAPDDRFAVRPSWPPQPMSDAFESAQPLAYWRPSSADLSRIKRALNINRCRSIWDIGGGNGFFSWCLQHFVGISSLCVEPIARYQNPEVSWFHGDDDAALKALVAGTLEPPDALFISWPSPGRGYQQLIEMIKPKVIIRAYDRAGFCGARRGYRSVLAQGGRLLWWRAPGPFDLETSALLPESVSWTVTSYRDLRASGENQRTPQGAVTILSQHPWTDSMSGLEVEVGLPLSWE
jgi:hypothetical protein